MRELTTITNLFVLLFPQVEGVGVLGQAWACSAPRPPRGVRGATPGSGPGLAALLVEARRGPSLCCAMQLLALNALLMFDVVFVFFLFLVGVSCLAYYLPATTRRSTPRIADPEPPPSPRHYVTDPSARHTAKSPVDQV